MKVLPAALGVSDEHYHRLDLSHDRIELWEDGMRTDGGKGTYECGRTTFGDGIRSSPSRGQRGLLSSWQEQETSHQVSVQLAESGTESFQSSGMTILASIPTFSFNK